MPCPSVKLPDLAWLTLFSARRAVLWLGEECDSAGKASEATLVGIAAHPWHSIFEDGLEQEINLETAVPTELVEPLTLRRVEQDPDATRLAPNRIPVYALPRLGAGGALETLIRLKMLQRIPAGATVFAVMSDDDSGLGGLREALEVSPDVNELVIVSLKPPASEFNVRRATHWETDAFGVESFLRNLAPPKDRLRQSATIVVAADGGIRPVDLSRAIDPSSSVLDSFELIPSDQVLAEVAPSEALVEELLDSPSNSWLPFAARVPFDRTGPYMSQLRVVLKEFARKGSDATCTAWLEAEQASGATTLLRSIAFEQARLGNPVLVARSGAVEFDFQQLSAFLRASAPILREAGGNRRELPWLIAFDAEHTVRDRDFLAGVANGLRKFGHLAIVLGVLPVIPSNPPFQGVTHGPAIRLGPRLSNAVTRDEAETLGRHLNGILKPDQRRAPSDWLEFLQQSQRLTGEGRQSLFWLALRFWLLRFPGSDQPLRQWLTAKLESATAGSDDALSGIAEIALLSAHRLAMPYQLLPGPSRKALQWLLDGRSQPFGLRALWSQGQLSYALAHPLVAEEVLRICAGETPLLKRLGVAQCSGLFDLQLTLFERVLSRESIGDPRVLHVIEEIVTAALRVDPRESPRNYFARDRIVFILERAPDSVFDGSQLFLHHLAKARRHVAAEPPATEYWRNPENVREQLQLAESHIESALAPNFVVDEDRRESPLNLFVTLALTQDLRSRFEAEQGNESVAAHFAECAQRQYAKAQALDPDNTYVLENFARFKLREAREARGEGPRVRLAVEAVTLLEWEMEVDGESRRRNAILETLVAAYSFLQSQVGLERLRSMALEGDEAAAIAVARSLAYPERFADQSGQEPDWIGAIELLRAVPAGNVSWRSRLLLYQMIAKALNGDFAARLEAADELAAMSGFSWPLQSKLEYAILLFQLGRHRDGQQQFAQIREMLASRSGAVSVPEELRYLADPKARFAVPIKTSIRVTNTSSVGRYYGIPHGWGAVSIPFRPYLFARRRISTGDDLDCLIQFTQFGPQAVPPTEA